MVAIDISRYQGTVDFNAVKAAGVGIVIAKMGGDDAGEYVDANWTRNRDGIRAAGLVLGSYFFNGPGSTPTQAADFQFGNIDYRPGDLVVIDVEGGAIAWNPAQVLEWANRMISHGVPASSVGVYMSASVVRSENWAAVAALGTFLWVAAYGANTGQPGTPPVIAYWPGWSLWQYTSNGSIPGVPGRVDVSQVAPNWSSGTITPLNNSQEDLMLIIDGGLTPNRKAIALAGGPGGYHVFTGDEWSLFYNQHNVPALMNLPTVRPVGDAGWDLFATIFAPTVQQVSADVSGVLASITAAVTALETHEDIDQASVLTAIHSAVLANPGSPVDLGPVLAAIAALSTSDAGYAQQVEAILAKGLTVTGTATPAK